MSPRTSKKKATRRKAPAKKTPTRKTPGAKAKKKAAPAGRTLVTGATGFLGRHLVELLTQKKGRVVAMARHPSLRLEKLGVDVVPGDVRDAQACALAMKGVDRVYHLAGFVSRDDDDAPAMFSVHVEGTRNILRAASAAGVKRVVVVSTSGTLAVSDQPDVVSNEESGYTHTFVAKWPYYLSKIYQEQTAFSLAAELGVDVVVVNPSLLLGPGDERSSSTGDVERIVKGQLPVIPKGGGVAFVDARDAAAGCVAAMEKGAAGERYLLSAANMTLETFLGRLARLAEVPTPRAIVAPKTMKLVGGLVESLARRFDVKAPFDRQSIEMGEHTWYCDSTKATEHLGWRPRDPQMTLSDTVIDVMKRLGRGRHSDQASVALP